MAGSERPFALDAPLGPWRALDGWVAGYALLTLGVAGLGALRGVPGCPAQAAVSLRILGVALGMAWLTRNTASRVLLVLRLFYAPLLYWSFYHQVQFLWPVWWSAPLDRLLAALEERVWGFQPALAFRAALPHRWLSELFCFAYFAYYTFVPVLGLTVLVRRGYRAAERIIRSVTILFFTCYTFFWLAPTVGPHYWFPPGRGPELAQGYVFNHLLFFLTSGGEIRGAAFPSSHLAVALLLTLHARRAAPALFPAMAVITALMVPAVVYLRAHYALDVPAGLLAGWAAYLASRPAQDERPSLAV